jgi:hypothetical protein
MLRQLVVETVSLSLVLLVTLISICSKSESGQMKRFSELKKEGMVEGWKAESWKAES